MQDLKLFNWNFFQPSSNWPVEINDIIVHTSHRFVDSQSFTLLVFRKWEADWKIKKVESKTSKTTYIDHCSHCYSVAMGGLWWRRRRGNRWSKRWWCCSRHRWSTGQICWRSPFLWTVVISWSRQLSVPWPSIGQYVAPSRKQECQWLSGMRKDPPPFLKQR